MDNKGFTLVEVIAIILVLSIILTVGFTSLSKTLKDAKTNDYEQFIDTIELSAETYCNLPGKYKLVDASLKETGKYQVTVASLLESGVINEIPINPKTKKEISTEDYIVVTKNNNNELVFSYTPTS